MFAFLKILLTMAAALALGLSITAYALSGVSPFDSVRLGPWIVRAHAGSMQADPYTRAILERSGEIPLANGEGIQMIAWTDDAGRELDSRCIYSIGPRVPAARYWTLSLIDKRGIPVANLAERYVFRSSEILRSGGGGFAIAVAAEVQPGNWLPIGAPGRFGLALRLYDSPLGATAGEIERSTAPGITRIGCG